MWNFASLGYGILTKLELIRMMDFSKNVSADITIFYSVFFSIPALIISHKCIDNLCGKIIWLISVVLNICIVIYGIIVLYAILIS